MDDEAGRRLRGMSGHVRTQSGDPEVRAVVYKSAVLQSKGDVPHESVVHAPAVNKCRAGLPLCTTDKSSCVARGIKHKSTCSREHIGPHPRNIDGNVDDQRSGSLMHVGLDSEVSDGSEILLGIAIVAVASL